MNVLGLLAVLGLALATPLREKRQAACLSAFQNVPNVCRNNPTGQVFFSHPSDTTKFLQCDIYSRMYIIQCPQGEVFSLLTSGCEPSQQQVVPPMVAPTTHRPPATVTVAVPTPAASNPCTPQSVLRGQLYFAYPGDNTKFIECDLQGNPSVLSCPTLLVWNQSILSCLYAAGTINSNPNTPTLNTTPTPQITANQPSNPCTMAAIQARRLFFPYPSDATKYIQCDLWGQAFVNSCPPHLEWQAALETCYSPYLQMAPNGK